MSAADVAPGSPSERLSVGETPIVPLNRIDRLRFFRRYLRRLEAMQIRLIGSSVLSVLFRTPVLLLRTTGRVSGRPVETPLAYLRRPANVLLVVGGAGGQTRLPDWVLNLRADPNVIVTVDRRPLRMTAVELTGADRAAAWASARREWPQIDKYEALAGRPVPVIELMPTASTPR